MKLRRYFFTGTLITLPVFITVYFLSVIIKFFNNIFGKSLNNYLYDNFGFVIPGIGLIIVILLLLMVGFMAANFFGKRLISALEMWFLKLPFIRQIYPAAKQIVDSFMSKDGRTFKKVVMAQYPSKGLWTLGFLTNDAFEEANRKTGRDLLHILIASTPSPFTGYLVLIPKEEVIFLDISIEEGIKLIVSGGIVKP